MSKKEVFKWPRGATALPLGPVETLENGNRLREVGWSNGGLLAVGGKRGNQGGGEGGVTRKVQGRKCNADARRSGKNREPQFSRAQEDL